MLKKAGIIVAAAAAGLLAVSPLAFAGEGDNEQDRGHSSETNQETDNSVQGDSSLLNVEDNNTNIPIQVCNTDVPILAVDVEDVAGALGLLGDAEADTGDEGGQRTCESEGGAGNDSVGDTDVNEIDD